MKYKGFYLLGLCCCLLSFGVKAQQAYADTIPYEIVAGKMIVSAEINGETVRFIYDSGGKNILMWDAAKRFGVRMQGYSQIQDVNRQSKSVLDGVLPELSLSTHHQLKGLPVMVIGQFYSFEKLGVVGSLGNSAFGNVVLTILSRSRQLVINYPYRPAGLPQTALLPLTGTELHQSVIPVTVNGVRIPALFDTGASGFLLLNNADYTKLSSAGKARSTDWFYGISAMGVNGLPAADSFYRVPLDTFQMAGKTFTQVESVTSNFALTLLGIDAIDYGRVVMDFPRSRFYFIPYETAVTPMGNGAAGWDVKILPVKDHFEIAGYWSGQEGKVRFGEKVININGTSLATMELNELLITDLMDKMAGNTAYILVQREKGTEKVMIHRNN